MLFDVDIHSFLYKHVIGTNITHDNQAGTNGLNYINCVRCGTIEVQHDVLLIS